MKIEQTLNEWADFCIEHRPAKIVYLNGSSKLDVWESSKCDICAVFINSSCFFKTSVEILINSGYTKMKYE